jgi:sulfotransferase family protein
MERRSQLGLSFRSRAEICEEPEFGGRVEDFRRSPEPGDCVCWKARRCVPRRGVGPDWMNFGDPPIEQALSILVNSLELEADLHPLGRFLMQVHLRELLETRLRLAQAWSGRLEALEASLIQRPVFITGMPRSGSTFPHELLAEDPENRVPRVWEVIFPLRIESASSNKVDSRVRNVR